VCTPTDKTYDKNQRTDQPAHSWLQTLCVYWMG
jgi:hypothetical protein